MPTLEMSGPYPYDEETIDNLIPENIVGNYALGYIDPQDRQFVVQYVGRSDHDLRSRIKHSIGKYSVFKFSQALSPLDAYWKECRNWHDFGGESGWLDNKIHPDKPDNSKLAFCPVCTKRIMDKINPR